MKKKKLSFRHQIVAEMPLTLLLELIKVGAFTAFINNAAEEHDEEFLKNYKQFFNNKLDFNCFRECEKFRIFFSQAFTFERFEGESYWWRKYWEMIR